MENSAHVVMDNEYEDQFPKERKLRVSEIFYSIEGEGPLTGLPTVFVRTFGCNFTCQGFSNPERQEIKLFGTDDLKKFKSTVGCDSIYSWHPQYKDITKWYTITAMAEAILDLLPQRKIINSRSGESPILSFTGGEPTMHQTSLLQLLQHPLMADFNKVLIETNAAYDLKPEFIAGLNEWQFERPERLVIWGCSPKLSISGELRDKAIRPEIIRLQRQLDCMQYFKFVSDGSVESFNEIEETVKAYNEYLKPFDDVIYGHSIYIMPVGATSEQQSAIQREVANRCIEYGYSFCIRAHCFVYNNEVGT